MRGIRRLFRIRPRTAAAIERDTRDEIAAHVRLATDYLIDQGVSPADAAAQARARFGNLDATLPTLYASAKRRESRIDVREWFGAVYRDIVFAARQLRRSPAFTVGVIACLGFGTGASATVFSWMEGMVLHPLPAVRDAERLVTIRADDGQASFHSGSTRARGLFVSIPEYRDWVAQATSITGLAAASPTMFGVETNPSAGDGRAEPFYGYFTSANYFEVVGVTPALGRRFASGDDRQGAAPVAVVSDRLWRTRMGASPTAVGSRILLNGYPTTVIGVAPPNFGGTMASVNFDLWVPFYARRILTPSENAPLESRDFRWLDVIGRLAAGTTMSRAGVEFNGIARRLERQYAENRGHTINVESLDTGVAEQLRPLFVALTGLAMLVMLIVCSNIANLLLVRSAARSREIGVRLSLGASRARVVRQLMTENALLAALGAALGFVIAYFARGLLAQLLPATSVPLVVQATIDFRVLAFLLGVTSAAVMLFGLAPALRASRVNLNEILKNGGRGSGTARSRVRSTLVVAQFALSLTALVCGAVFLRRSQLLRDMDRGFKAPEHVLVAQTDMSFAGYRDAAAWQRTVNDVVDRLQRVPGVTAASVATFVPLGFIGPRRSDIAVDGYAPKTGESMRVAINGVAPGYFELMGIGLSSGRTIGVDDGPGRPGVVVVNESLARQYLAGSTVVGRQLVYDGRRVTVVGVVKNSKFDYKRIDDPAGPMLYYATRQSIATFVTFHVRTEGDPVAVIPLVRDAIRAVDPRIPIVAPMSLAEYTAVPMFPSRLGVAVLGVLSAAALVLAAMGLYSVIAYGVALRSREIGIRLAIGGTPITVMLIFVRESVRLLVAGVMVGLVVSAGATRLLHAQVGFLELPNAATMFWPAVLLGAVALVAGFLPARRAASIDLAGTLRAE